MTTSLATIPCPCPLPLPLPPPPSLPSLGTSTHRLQRVRDVHSLRPLKHVLLGMPLLPPPSSLLPPPPLLTASGECGMCTVCDHSNAFFSGCHCVAVTGYFLDSSVETYGLPLLSILRQRQAGGRSRSSLDKPSDLNLDFDLDLDLDLDPPTHIHTSYLRDRTSKKSESFVLARYDAMDRPVWRERGRGRGEGSTSSHWQGNGGGERSALTCCRMQKQLGVGARCGGDTTPSEENRTGGGGNQRSLVTVCRHRSQRGGEEHQEDGGYDKLRP